MAHLFGDKVRTAFAPPAYLASGLAGIDVSTSGVKVARLAERSYGMVLDAYAQARLPAGAFADGEVVDHDAVAAAIVEACKAAGVRTGNASLPESKSYLFEATAPGREKAQWRTAVEQHLEEYIPLPIAEAAFDIVPVGSGENGTTLLAGIGFASRVIQETLGVFDQARVPVRALESETFAMARALLPQGDPSTVLVIDVGKTTTKLAVIERQIPRFATTIGIGGHTLTLAVQKFFGVTEEEARRVKAERGIVPAPGNQEYLEAMLSTVSAIRDEINRRLDYWQERVAQSKAHEPVSRVILAGGNASLRGLPEYLEGVLRVPVVVGDVFKNLASRDDWLPELDYRESLAYGTAIGLALRDDVSHGS